MGLQTIFTFHPVVFSKRDKKTKPKPQRSFVLNEHSWSYEVSPKITYDLANTLSHNTLSKITDDSRQHILDDDYFTNFVPQNLLNGFS